MHALQVEYTSDISQYFAYIWMNIHTSPEVDSLGRKVSKASSNLNYNHRQENCNGDEEEYICMFFLSSAPPALLL